MKNLRKLFVAVGRFFKAFWQTFITAIPFFKMALLALVSGAGLGLFAIASKLALLAPETTPQLGIALRLGWGVMCLAVVALLYRAASSYSAEYFQHIKRLEDDVLGLLTAPYLLFGAMVTFWLAPSLNMTAADQTYATLTFLLAVVVMVACFVMYVLWPKPRTP